MAALNLAGKTSGYIKLKSPDVALNATVELPNKDGTLATLDDVSSGGGGGVPEAPIDGKQYARQDEAWSEVNHLESNRNILINGDMRIDQRNGGASVTPTDGLYTIDRWLFRVSQASKLTAQQVSDAPTGFDYSLKVTSSSAYTVGVDDFFECEQRIEGNNVYHLDLGTSNAKTVTLSFWVKSSLTGTFGGALANDAFNRSYPFEYNIDTANTWEKKTVTVALDTTGEWARDIGIGLRVQFGLGVGGNWSAPANNWITTGTWSAQGATSVVGTLGATWQLTGVQLEVSDTATDFEHLPYDIQLQRCQRYCQVYGGNTVAEHFGLGTSFSSTDSFITVSLLTPMRHIPSLSYNLLSHFRLLFPGVTGTKATNIIMSTDDSSQYRICVQVTSDPDANMGGGKAVLFTDNETGNARLTLQAEL